MRLDLHRRATSVGIVVLIAATILAMVLAHFLTTPTPMAHAASVSQPFCAARPALCTETTQPWNYAGAVYWPRRTLAALYSTVPGSGNSNLYQLTLPTDPPTLPKQDGTAGTWNFQLHPAFWFGMAMCDDQSAPHPGKPLALPIATPTSTRAPTRTPRTTWAITPGTGFMEMQFYPPGWDSFGCNADTVVRRAQH